MAGRRPGVKKIAENTRYFMKELGVYKAEYEPIIEIYAELQHEYNTLTSQWKSDNYAYQNSTAAGNGKKSPLVSTLESLRKDILAYSDRLCLNPKAMMEQKNKKKARSSRMEKALEAIE